RSGGGRSLPLRIRIQTAFQVQWVTRLCQTLSHHALGSSKVTVAVGWTTGDW
ncbi:hypothetical protein chiPu_0028175, partial [Chiloscyllium punctatum]|nr:hypothetical protein [Chiloscyllium punctatum]